MFKKKRKINGKKSLELNAVLSRHVPQPCRDHSLFNGVIFKKSARRTGLVCRDASGSLLEANLLFFSSDIVFIYHDTVTVLTFRARVLFTGRAALIYRRPFLLSPQCDPWLLLWSACASVRAIKHFMFE